MTQEPNSSERVAVVLLNLGGPDGPEAVEPFLRNLFSDPAIIRLPAPFRLWLARLIAWRRAPTARAIYENLGGGSPIVAETEAQADALQKLLVRPGREARVFIAMRYWHPRADETIRQIMDFGPDRLILLPLYPQFSTATSQSSLEEIRDELRRVGLEAQAVGPCCYPIDRGFVEAYADLVAAGLSEAAGYGPARLLFSAHGLPERVIKAGDPYAWQVEQTAAAIIEKLSDRSIDWRVTYQSRVGPLKWIGPATDDEIKACASEGLVPVICPLAFVSEHSETLVELDIEYRELAVDAGAPGYVRIPTVGTTPAFIAGLAKLVEGAMASDATCVYSNARSCPASFAGCPQRSF